MDSQNGNKQDAVDNSFLRVREATKSLGDAIREFGRTAEQVSMALSTSTELNRVFNSVVKIVYSTGIWIKFRVGPVAFSRYNDDGLLMAEYAPGWKHVVWRFWLKA
jgi:hypothetical protein